MMKAEAARMAEPFKKLRRLVRRSRRFINSSDMVVYFFKSVSKRRAGPFRAASNAGLKGPRYAQVRTTPAYDRIPRDRRGRETMRAPARSDRAVRSVPAIPHPEHA